MSDNSQKLATLLIQTTQKALLLLLLPYVRYHHEHYKSKAQGFWQEDSPLMNGLAHKL